MGERYVGESVGLDAAFGAEGDDVEVSLYLLKAEYDAKV